MSVYAPDFASDLAPALTEFDSTIRQFDCLAFRAPCGSRNTGVFWELTTGCQSGRMVKMNRRAEFDEDRSMLIFARCETLWNRRIACLGRVAIAAGAIMAAQAGFADEGLIGWASFQRDKLANLDHAPVTVVKTSDELKSAVKGSRAKLVVIDGMLSVKGMIPVGSNTVVRGQDAQSGLTGGGLLISDVENVEVHNLTIAKSSDDAITIHKGSKHVWIDHCDFSSCHDGLVDVTQGSDLVTVSWCHFHDHHKTCLVGHSDKEKVLAEDRGKLRVTFHHNYFDGTQTRHPRVRAGETVHVFNNYFHGNEYGVASLQDAGVLVEGNVFEDVKQPTLTIYASSKVPGRLVEKDNLFLHSGEPKTAGEVRPIGKNYVYTLDDASKVADTVKKQAGPRSGPR
jgi:pectate lyase